MKFLGANTGTSKATVFDTNGNLIASSVTSAELGYVSGVTSAIQTQLNNKLNSASIKRGTGTFLSNSAEVTIAHGLGSSPVAVTVTPIAATSAGTGGTVGEIWTRFDSTNIYVGNTGSSVTTFSWIAMT